MNVRLHAILSALTSASFAIALYAVTLGGTYVYDDFDILFNDPRISHPDQWRLYCTQSYNGGVDNLYRPLVSMSYVIQWRLHGDKPWAFHLVNVLLNALVCALVAELARRLAIVSKRRDGASGPPAACAIATIAGLLFAAHPIHVEAVANIVGRAELMCAAGALGALVMFLHRPMTIARAIAIAACVIVSVMSKEQGMLVPLLLLVLAGSRKMRRDNASGGEAACAIAAEQRATLVLTLLLSWTLASYIFLRERILKFWWDRSFLDATIQPMILSHGIDRWLMPLVLLGRYTLLLICPARLSPDYGGNVIGSIVRLDDPYLYTGMVALIVWAALSVFAIHKRRGAMLFCLLALAITYAPISNFFLLIGTNFGERLMYLPSAFFLILLAIGLTRLPRALTAIAAIVIICVLSARTFTYARSWNDRLSFYETCLNEQPRSIRLHMLVASELMSRGRLDDAAQAAARGRDLMPDYNEVWIQSGVIALAQDKLDNADAFLDKALNLRPSMKALGWKGKVAERRAATQATTKPH